MASFNNLEEVKKLYESVNGLESENNFFVGIKDARKNSGMVNGMEYPYNGLLINFTEKGLGVFYLDQPGLGLTLKLSKMNVKEDSYFFIKNEDIESIVVKKFALLNNKIKTVYIRLKDGKEHIIDVKLEEPDYPYHNSGFSKFLEKYSN